MYLFMYLFIGDNKADMSEGVVSVFPGHLTPYEEL